MAHRGGRALASFLLAVTAAGLNISYASSVGPSIPSSTAPSELTKFNRSAATTSVGPPSSPQTGAPTTLSYQGRLSTQDSTPVPNTTVEALTTNPVSGATALDSSTAAHSSPQPNTGLTRLPTMGETSASATSVAGTATGTIPQSETSPFSSSPTLNGSSTNSSSTDAPYLSTAGVTQVPITETSAAAVPPSEPPTKAATSGETSVAASSPGAVQGATSSQVDLSSKATPVISPTGSTTFSGGVTIQEVQRALSSGSIAAITITVIVVVLLVFGIAAFLKIRHSSYGRLLDDHDYGSWGNYNNPLYDDS